MSETIKINKESIKEAIKSLNETKAQLSDYPGYDLKTIFKESQGKSKDEIVKLFNAMDELKSTLLLSFEKTAKALEVIENNFSAFDQTFAQDFKKRS